MLYVIGTSYSVELAIKGLYESSMGRLTEWISGSYSTNADRIIHEKHKAYADFVHIYPWYEFDFLSHFKDFWKRTETREGPFLRFWERRIFFTVEYLFKSAYGWMIKKGTQTGYEPEAAEIYAIGVDDGRTFERFSDDGKLKVLERDGRQALLELKRYDDFREMLKRLARDPGRAQFLEISGNRTIFLTLIHERKTVIPFPKERISGYSRIPTDPGRERLLVTVPVGELIETIRQAVNSGMSVEHVFDY